MGMCLSLLITLLYYYIFYYNYRFFLSAIMFFNNFNKIFTVEAPLLESVEQELETIIPLEDRQTNAVTALQIVDFNAIAEKVGLANPWLLFDTYLNKVSGTCAELTEAKWVDRLGGVDVFTDSHCFQLIENLRVN